MSLAGSATADRSHPHRFSRANRVRHSVSEVALPADRPTHLPFPRRQQATEPRAMLLAPSQVLPLQETIQVIVELFTNPGS
jgi:hypothetical protein